MLREAVGRGLIAIHEYLVCQVALCLPLVHNYCVSLVQLLVSHCQTSGSTVGAVSLIIVVGCVLVCFCVVMALKPIDDKV